MALHKNNPKTKAGKQRKVGKVLREFKEGTLRSSSGKKVTNPRQAKAISLTEAGLGKRRKGTKRGR